MTRGMRLSLLALVLATAAAACGGKQKKSEPIPLPEPKVEETAKPAEPEAKPEEEAAKPEVPQGPLEVLVTAAKPTVKLVSAGKGKKVALKIAPKAGLKQQVELALDFQGGQDGPPEAGGKQDQIAPTVVLAADVETKEAAPDGQTNFHFVINGVDAKDTAGSKVSGEQFKNELTSLVGATLDGTVGTNGSTSDIKLRVEKPDEKTAEALALVRTVLLPMWPVLPKRAIGPGAKWTVTTTEKVADQLEVTKTVNYELVSKKGDEWAIKSTTKISGSDQDLQGAKIGSIGGTGTAEHTVKADALVPATKQKLETEFTITAQGPGADGQPKEIKVKFHIEQANALTVK